MTPKEKIHRVKIIPIQTGQTKQTKQTEQTEQTEQTGQTGQVKQTLEKTKQVLLFLFYVASFLGSGPCLALLANQLVMGLGHVVINLGMAMNGFGMFSNWFIEQAASLKTLGSYETDKSIIELWTKSYNLHPFSFCKFMAWVNACDQWFDLFK